MPQAGRPLHSNLLINDVMNMEMSLQQFQLVLCTAHARPNDGLLSRTRGIHTQDPQRACYPISRSARGRIPRYLPNR